MSVNEAAETELATVSISHFRKFGVDIPHAAPVHLQTLDLARHVAVAPDGKRYVVATFDGTRVGHKYVITVYPQQGHYLTLIRLPVCEFHAEQPEEAIQRHIAVVQAIQQGEMKTYITHNQ